MPGSEEMYGDGHSATYDIDDPDNPDYDPERAAAYRQKQSEVGKHLGQLSGEAFGDEHPEIKFPGRAPKHDDGPIDN